MPLELLRRTKKFFFLKLHFFPQGEDQTELGTSQERAVRTLMKFAANRKSGIVNLSLYLYCFILFTFVQARETETARITGTLTYCTSWDGFA